MGCFMKCFLYEPSFKSDDEMKYNRHSSLTILYKKLIDLCQEFKVVF